jgi:hypothetical protein
MEEKMPKANNALKSQWKHRLEMWQSSGQTIAAWCREQNVVVHTFYYWRSKLMPATKVPSDSQSKFIELVDKPSGISGISIECCGVVLHIAKDFHPASLISCLQTLRKI